MNILFNETYIWYGEVYEVLDGDTFRCHLDMGADQWQMKQKIRLWNCDTPETRIVSTAKDPEKLKAFGEAVATYVQGLFEHRLVGDPNTTKRIKMRSEGFQRDAFTRYLVDFHLDATGDRTVREELLHLGFAIPYLTLGGQPKDKATRTKAHEANMERLIAEGKISL